MIRTRILRSLLLEATNHWFIIIYRRNCIMNYQNVRTNIIILNDSNNKLLEICVLTIQIKPIYFLSITIHI